MKQCPICTAKTCIIRVCDQCGTEYPADRLQEYLIGLTVDLEKYLPLVLCELGVRSSSAESR